MKLYKYKEILILGVVFIMASCASYEVNTEIKKSGYRAGVSVHDPSVIRANNGDFYIFGSHMDSAISSNLFDWKKFTSGVSPRNPLFSNLLNGDKDAFSFVGRNDQGGYSVWAPDVIYNKTLNKYFLYFCTTSSYIKSNICYATSDNLEGPYEYQGTIVYSGFNRGTLKETNVLDYVDEVTAKKRYLNFSSYNNQLWPNAIDPALFYDKDGRMWMAYGSWSGGMFILEIDVNTGLPIHPEGDEENAVDPYFGKHLAGGLHNSIEGPYIIYSPESDYYYMFVSYGSLVSDGGYQIRQYRSKNPDGPYLDTMGQEFGAEVSHNKFGLKMMGNYTFPSLSKAYKAPGHNSAIRTEDGNYYLIFHVRFDDGSEYHEPRAHQMFINKDGWLVAAPFLNSKSGIEIGEGNFESGISGGYYFVNHGTDIGKEIHEPELLFLKTSGSIVNANKKKVGSYSLNKESNYIDISLGNDLYSGLYFEQSDEAGNPVVSLSLVGNNNQTLWGVKYK